VKKGKKQPFLLKRGKGFLQEETARDHGRGDAGLGEGYIEGAQACFEEKKGVAHTVGRGEGGVLALFV